MRSGHRADLMLTPAARIVQSGTAREQGRGARPHDGRQAGRREAPRVRTMSQAGRRYPRYQIAIALPVTCCRKEDGERVGGRGLAMNVSRGGLLVLLSAAVPVETLLSVEVQTATQRLTSDARVVRVEDPRPDGLIPH